MMPDMMESVVCENFLTSLWRQHAAFARHRDNQVGGRAEGDQAGAYPLSLRRRRRTNANSATSGVGMRRRGLLPWLTLHFISVQSSIKSYLDVRTWPYNTKIEEASSVTKSHTGRSSNDVRPLSNIPTDWISWYLDSYWRHTPARMVGTCPRMGHLCKGNSKRVFILRSPGSSYHVPAVW
jgi:hypothetical protein